MRKKRDPRLIWMNSKYYWDHYVDLGEFSPAGIKIGEFPIGLDDSLPDGVHFFK